MTKARTLRLPKSLTQEHARPDGPARALALLQAHAPATIEARILADDTAELDIFGPIGEWGVSASQVRTILSEINTSLVVVNVNSPGGDVFEGIAIHNLLRQYRGEVEVRVMGLAASAASVIAMSGDTIRIADGAFLMIHNAWSVAVGDKHAMRKMADTLDQIDAGGLVKLYAARTGASEKELTKMLDEETWFSAEQAVDAGFADEILDTAETKANAWNVAAYRNAPKGLLAKRSRGSQTEKTSSPSVSVADLLAQIGSMKTPFLGAAVNVKSYQRTADHPSRNHARRSKSRSPSRH